LDLDLFLLPALPVLRDAPEFRADLRAGPSDSDCPRVTGPRRRVDDDDDDDGAMLTTTTKTISMGSGRDWRSGRIEERTPL